MTNVSKNKNTKRAIFLHLPKTAGLTLHGIIERQYAPQNVYTIDPTQIPESVQAFQGLHAARRAEIYMLKGHMNMYSEMHEFLPKPVTYFTLLRDPIDRTISQYYFIRGMQSHYFKDLIGDMSLQEVLERDIAFTFNNQQTRWLAGERNDIGYGGYKKEVLERAKRNLRERFAVVGLTERFDETLLLLKHTYDWPHDVFYTRTNVTTRRPKKDEVPPATLNAIVQANLLDIELYQYATALFEEQIRQQGPLFPLKVKTFKSINRLHGSHAYQQIRKEGIQAFIRRRLNSAKTFIRRWSLRVFIRKWTRRILDFISR
jgi:hypothetical protein